MNQIVKDIYEKICIVIGQILCFSNKGKSSTMWKKFGCSYKGIQIVLDKNIVIQYANKSSNPDVLMDCIYTNRINRMK